MDTTTAPQKSINPLEIVKRFQLKPGDAIADFGSGHGHFTVPLAQAVGNNGTVYAIDVQKEVLDIVRTKATFEHLLNIKFIVADLETPGASGMGDQTLDFALIANILFQLEQKEVLLREVYRILEPHGRLALIEWDEQSNSALGPPQEMRVRKAHIKGAAQEIGFEFQQEFNAGAFHYGLLFKK